MHHLPLAPTSWTFRDATKRSPWRAAVVPGCVHRDLLRHQLIVDPFHGTNELDLQWIEERDWDYATTFEVSEAMLADEVVELVADGLDTVATITLNGELVATTENMFVGFRWDVKHLLHAGRNKLEIRFGSAMHYIRTNRLAHRPREFNDPVGGCTSIRKQQCQFGWDWGPRLVTAGIWRDIRLESWSGNRLKSARVAQTHNPDGSVTLNLTPELEHADAGVVLRGVVSLEGKAVAIISDLKFQISNPALWWPNGQGAQPLYTIEVEALEASGNFIGVWKQRIGLRTIVLDRHKDPWGESFQFLVNGRAIFAKGANCIPAHSFVAALTRADYERDLRAAQAAHMNMIRVWGGGIYESEDFYDLCDELGLLVWQDFMFACTLYPADEAFLATSGEEADHQVRRLRHRACLALWCGNNEVFGCNHNELTADPAQYADYEKLFHDLLPTVVASTDGVTPYWPSSPWRGSADNTHAAGEISGDTHFWDVWHARHPVKDYEKHVFRFASEFGMQSYSSTATQKTFCSDEDNNVFGPAMKNHQKNRAGNQIILDYVSRLYRFPKSQDDLIYLSQLNQACCMQAGVEHYRRNMPRCMGALYWQLNDCWPVASWSSIEFTGRWRALHHVAKRFFAPAIVSAQVPGDETDIIGNYRRSTIHEVNIYTVYDAPGPAKGVVRWDVYHLGGRRLKSGRKRVALRHGESVKQQTLDLATLIKTYSRDELYVHIALEIAGERVSEDTVFLTSPKFVHLHKVDTRVSVKMAGDRRATLTFTSPELQHRFAFDIPGIPHHASDNYFDLYPGEKKSVEIEFAHPITAARVKKRMTHRSLVDTY